MGSVFIGRVPVTVKRDKYPGNALGAETDGIGCGLQPKTLKNRGERQIFLDKL